MTRRLRERLRSVTIHCLLATAAGIGMRCHNPSTETVTTASSPQSGQKVDVGYVRPPSHKRVIIFMHGIFGSAHDTWRSRAAYWPALLLDDSDHAFDDADIYVHEYPTRPMQKGMRIDDLAGLAHLDLESVIASHDEVIFLCHSMGGLVAREYMIRYAKELDGKVKMLYYFSTPSSGAQVAEIGRHFLRSRNLAEMSPSEGEAFLQTQRNLWNSFGYAAIPQPCAFENEATDGLQIVNSLSASAMCNQEITGLPANHITIVKPASQNDPPYKAFKIAYLKFIRHTETEKASACKEEWTRFDAAVVAERSSSVAKGAYYLPPGASERVVMVQLGNPYKEPFRIDHAVPPIDDELDVVIETSGGPTSPVHVTYLDASTDKIGKEFSITAAQLPGVGEFPVSIRYRNIQPPDGHYFFAIGGTAFCNSETYCGQEYRGFHQAIGQEVFASKTIYRSGLLEPKCSRP